MSKSHSVRSNAVRSARKVLGKDAKQGVHFVIDGNKESGFTWAAIEGAPAVEASAVVEKPSEKAPKSPETMPAEAKAPKQVRKYLKKRTTKPNKSSDDVSGKRRKLIAMVTSPKGASLDTLTKALGWQKHTVRGAISTAVSDGLITQLRSVRHERRGRVYIGRKSTKKAA